MKNFIHTLQPHLGLSGTTMFLDVSQALLHDTKQTERYVSLDSRGDVLMMELDPDVLLFAELLTEGFYPGDQSEALKGR